MPKPHTESCFLKEEKSSMSHVSLNSKIELLSKFQIISTKGDFRSLVQLPSFTTEENETKEDENICLR